MPGSRAHITTGANARMCASTHVLMHAKPREAITSLLSGLGLHGALHLGGGAREVSRDKAAPPRLNSSCITLGSHLAWRESTERVEIISPPGRRQQPSTESSRLRIQGSQRPGDSDRADSSQAALPRSHQQSCSTPPAGTSLPLEQKAPPWPWTGLHSSSNEVCLCAPGRLLSKRVSE